MFCNIQRQQNRLSDLKEFFLLCLKAITTKCNTTKQSTIINPVEKPCCRLQILQTNLTSTSVSELGREYRALLTHISHHYELLAESSGLQTRAPRAYFILLCTHWVKVVTNRHSFYRRLYALSYNAMLVLVTVAFVTTPACFVNQLTYTRGYSYTLCEPNLFIWELVMELKSGRGRVRGHRRG